MIFRTTLLILTLACAPLLAAKGKSKTKNGDNHHKDAYTSVTISNCNLQTFVAGLPQPIYFDEDIVSPFNITHPYQSDNSQFCVKREGAYLIGWKINLSNPGVDQVTFALWDMKKDQPIPQTAITVPVTGLVPVSAQYMIPLETGGVIKLVAQSQNGNTTMIQPTFFMTRVGH